MDRHEEAAPATRGERTMRRIVLVCFLILLVVVVILLSLIRSSGSSNSTTQAMADLRYLARGVQAHQARFRVAYIPSRIKLCKYGCQYDLGDQFDKDSFHYLNQMWPRLQWSERGSDEDSIAYLRIDWDGTESGGPARLVLNKDAKPPEKPAPVILEGDQCLVFFLGGIPVSVNGAHATSGFSTDPLNPAAGTGERLAPFYEFRSSRLVKLHDNPFYSYLDPHGSQPFAFFSAYGRRNGYNKYFTLFKNSDCSRLGVWPYATSLGQSPLYVNPDAFQIISAGADEKFGAGTVLPEGETWTPATAKKLIGTGRDDMSNFHPLLLGVAEE